MGGPCEGLRVVDFSISLPGALATMVLADGGAEVIKVEPPSGDPTRKHYASIMWHRGKKSIVLDLKTSKGQGDAQRLCAGADVVLHTFRPGVADGLAVDYRHLSQANPRLVYCSITGFGSVGPYASYKGYEGIVYAKSGRFENYADQIQKEGPTYGAVPIASYTSAMFAVQGVMAALRAREIGGVGQQVDVTLLQALAYQDLGGWIQWQMKQKDPNYPATGSFRAGDSVPYLVCRTKDGKWIQMGNLAIGLWENWLRALGLEALLEDPEYRNANRARPEVRESLRILLLEKMQEKTFDEWMRILTEEFDVACEPLLTTQEGMKHPQVVHNGLVIEMKDPHKGMTRQLGPLAKFSETPAGPQGPAPELGQHNSLITAPNHNGKNELSSGHLPPHPLSGLLVVELAEWLAAPVGTGLLADLGARVIKVERLEGDSFRGLNPTSTLKTIQGKESLAIDLKQPQAQEILRKLISRADILMHNMRPGVPERLGFEYERCRKLNPRLIYAYCGGYGSTGPSARRGAFHVIGGAISGGALYQAGKGMPPAPDTPMGIEEVRQYSRTLGNANEGNPDVNTGAALTAALLMALYSRERSGKGQYVEVTMIGANAYANSDDFISYPGKPERLLPDSELNGIHALYRLYPCRKGWVFLACLQDKEWSDFCHAVGIERVLKDKRFLNQEERLKHDRELTAAIQHLFSQRDATEWEQLLMPKDVPCAEVYEGRFGEFINTSPYRDIFGPSVKVPHTIIGDYYRYKPFYSLSATPCIARKNADVGEHTRSILVELGYSQEQIEKLHRDKIITFEKIQSGPS